MSNGKKDFKRVTMEKIEKILTDVYETSGFFDALVFSNGMKVFASADDTVWINEAVAKLSNRFMDETNSAQNEVE